MYLLYVCHKLEIYNTKYIDAIKNAQRRTTKQLPGVKVLECPDGLKRLGCPTLAYHTRVRGDMIQTYRYIKTTWDIRHGSRRCVDKDSAGMDGILRGVIA